MVLGFNRIVLSLIAQDALAMNASHHHHHDIDYDAVRADILDVMIDPSWDNGNYAATFIRLAWHASGTYNKEDKTGGSYGGTMRHALEAMDPQNAGLKFARDVLEPIQQKYPKISHGDLWVLASYVALEATNGPKIQFHPGRVDADERKAVAPGRLPDPERGLVPGMGVDSENRLLGWENLAQHIRDVFGRMGFTDEETVALMVGGHAYGRCHKESTGYEGAWMQNELYFSNEYAVDMSGDEWIPVTTDTKLANGAFVPDDLRPSGKRQYIDLTTIDPTVGFQGMRGDDVHKFTQEAEGLAPGQYKVADIWINVRQTADPSSDILVRLQQNATVEVIGLKTDGTGKVRGQLIHGGWVTIMSGSGFKYFERAGDFNMKTLGGEFRMIQWNAPAPIFESPDRNSAKLSQIPAGSDFECGDLQYDVDGNLYGQLSTGGWALVYSPVLGLLGEKKVHGWNENERRKPQRDQYGHQMMLVSDMVMKWDETFKKTLDIYADVATGTDRLREDFGKAFKKLTELGCHWSSENSVVV